MADMTVSDSAQPLDVQKMLKEAGLTAFVALMLCFGLVGFEVRDVSGGLAINTRFDDVAVAVALVFFGRIAMILLREHRSLPVLVAGSAFCGVLFLMLLSETFFGADVEIGRAHV